MFVIRVVDSMDKRLTKRKLVPQQNPSLKFASFKAPMFPLQNISKRTPKFQTRPSVLKLCRHLGNIGTMTKAKKEKIASYLNSFH